MNKLNGKNYSPEYYELLEKRKKLPANQLEVIDAFRDALTKFDLILVSANTGSGKSTQLCAQIFAYYGMIDNEFSSVKQTKKKKGGNSDI
jgi:HrpA-like RNA helicase